MRSIYIQFVIKNNYNQTQIEMSLRHKLVKLYEIEALRYRKKGILNIIIAITLLFSVFWGASSFCKNYWPEEINNKPLFILGISFCIHFVFQILYFLLYAPGYANLIASYDKYRINKGVLRPWEKKQTWPQSQKRLFFYLGLNYFIVYPAMIFMSNKLSGVKVRFTDPPSAIELAWQILFVAFVEDIGFYWAHRMAHQTKFMYKFHKVHHEYSEVFSLATEYMHPVDYIVGVLIPSAIPFILLGGRAHCFTFFFWQVWKMMVSTEGHCGYYFPWSPTRIFFFVSDPSFHDYHHAKNAGNYCGSIYLWDFFNGSSQNYFRQYGINMEEKTK